uniref:Uncharacterized protein n=1 Tax=mine drainage metagenome TaxID=410659 RepID=E6QTT2_9ZZZZ
MKNRMTSILIIHAAPPFMQHIIAAKAGGLNLMLGNEAIQLNRRPSPRSFSISSAGSGLLK